MTGTGRPVGYGAATARNDVFAITELHAETGALASVFAALVRHWQSTRPAATGVVAELGSSYPLYAMLQGTEQIVVAPYAWYVRVSDHQAWLDGVGDALTERLESLGIEGCTIWDGASPARIGATPNPAAQAARFPSGVVWKSILGWRSIDDLRHMYPDIEIDEPLATVWDELFPPTPSHVVACA